MKSNVGADYVIVDSHESESEIEAEKVLFITEWRKYRPLLILSKILPEQFSSEVDECLTELRSRPRKKKV